MRFVTVALAALPCALVGACLFPSLDGVTGDGGSAETSPEAASDANIAVDAQPDVRGPFCPQDGAVLCSDFDESDAGFLGTWDFAYMPGTTTMQLSTAFAASPPQSLLVATTNTDMGAALSKTVTFTNGMTASFDAYLVSFGNNPSLCTLSTSEGALSFQPHAANTSVSESTQLADGGVAYTGSTGGGTTALGGWVHFDFDFDRTTLLITGMINGQLAITHSITNATAWSTTTTAKLALGVGNSASETVYYDNVTLRSR